VFTLHDEPLDPGALKRTLVDTACGACATFEGWVRESNEGRRVHRLDYEAYAPVAVKEGGRIVQEACARFGVLHAACAHRVGSLDLGDLAVWVGVVSPHRAEAFEACRYIIDAIKHQVPIWKKEYYADGDSGWVNCERCAHAADPKAAALSPEDYYARQTILPEVGAAGQQRLRDARVLVVGAGGLGCGALPALAAAGVGLIGVCDGDRVEISNLHRQTLYTVAAAGLPKADVAAARLRALNPLITCRVHAEPLTETNAFGIISEYDLLLDCTDNFEAKYLLNDLAVRRGKTLVQAAIHQYEGQLFVYDPAAAGACLRCLWPEPPAPDCVGACADAGVLGAVPAVFGAMQAMEALKLLLGMPDRLSGAMLFLDLLSYRARRVPMMRNPECRACGHAAAAPQPQHESVELQIDLRDPAGYIVVDIRERIEAQLKPLDGIPHLAWPVSLWGQGAVPFPPEARYVLCCTQGRRSKQLALALRRDGYEVYSLQGGIRAWMASR